MNYEVVGSKTAYDGKILKVEVDEICYKESNRLSKREVVVKDAFAMVIPVAADGKVACVRQFRHPFREMALSFPAGRVDAGEDPEAAARRELEEEAGLRAARLVKLGEVHEVPEFARSIGHLFVAESLIPVEAKREEGEATMESEWLEVVELRRLVRRGQVKSVTVVAALHHFLDFQERKNLTKPSESPLGSSGCPVPGWLSSLSGREKAVLLLSFVGMVFSWMKRKS
eukprot:gnl/TRDRNA2_/TRDRNA2_53561_c0_seq1.p1 gnl/TRDRNA2_/TRDRNA2_53561_c0~~gnl/TRDRNA2_/TRDRNA2_53561_c0_seq1.p1  ORF type:complete len:228 (+),score=50.14 gnl/TRDRNA2_/TRDRNA2_53561_c0_seq1:61-744(+)